MRGIILEEVGRDEMREHNSLVQMLVSPLRAVGA